ncbi:MAG: hypothetical protein GY724_29310, partial [Actinomycetia bacterium]|nr:hypothetical protein [Actinomycetes bacterium]
MAKSNRGKMFAILARCQRSGRWRLASRFSVLALLGACRLDLRRAIVEGERSRVKVTVFLGSASVMLPPGAEVRPSGFSLLSASTVDIPGADETSELPLIEIEWITIFGRLRIGTEETLEKRDDPETQLDAEPAKPPPVVEQAQPEPAPTPATGVGFEDLEPAPELEPLPTPATGVGFEDLEPAPELEPLPTPATGVGFEDLESAPELEPLPTPATGV